MVIAGLVFAALAAALHVYIFVMESLTWTSPRTRATFGTTAEEAQATKELAFNQGFYNLFLAMVSVVGIVAVGLGHNAVGAALVFAATGAALACRRRIRTGPDGRTSRSPIADRLLRRPHPG
ncbi:DUF1304 domain-containing protein, partial [Mycolicibacterium porcinum]|uniref:DUF1304 domain-containing protein n=1 Tax=Mycolicibacterium porcinum TaxID=39693 RepID=UPI0008492975